MRPIHRSPGANPPPKRVQVLALRDCTALVPIGLFDLLRKSIELAASMGAGPPPVEVRLVAAGDDPVVRGAGGVELRCQATARRLGPGDLVVVPAVDPDVFEQLEKNRAAVRFVRRAFDEGADVASACTGAFVLAAAGLLDRRRATTHWAFQELMAARFPSVRLAPQAVLVDAGRVVTAGGATSFINLALLLVERLLGVEVARAASKMFLVDVNKSPQGAYAAFSTQKQHGDESIHRAQALIEEQVAPGYTVEQLARATGMSPRTFVRRFRRATGNSPREYMQRVRIEAARRELEAGEEPVASIAARVGYGDAVAFRKLFVRVTGLTPSDYRARYGPRAAPAWVAARSTDRR